MCPNLSQTMQTTHVSELLVARLRLLDQLRWVVTMNSTLLLFSDAIAGT